MDEDPPNQSLPADSEARSGAWHLAAPPTIFIVHFAAVYGWVGLACAFRWDDVGLGPLGIVPAVVILLTLLAVAALWWTSPPAEPEATGEMSSPYDPSERKHFLARASRMCAVLAAAGVVLVAVPSLLARTCAMGA